MKQGPDPVAPTATGLADSPVGVASGNGSPAIGDSTGRWLAQPQNAATPVHNYPIPGYVQNVGDRAVNPATGVPYTKQEWADHIAANPDAADNTFSNRHPNLMRGIALAAGGLREYAGEMQRHPGLGAEQLQPMVQQNAANRKWMANRPAMQQQANEAGARQSMELNKGTADIGLANSEAARNTAQAQNMGAPEWQSFVAKTIQMAQDPRYSTPKGKQILKNQLALEASGNPMFARFYHPETINGIVDSAQKMGQYWKANIGQDGIPKGATDPAGNEYSMDEVKQILASEKANPGSVPYASELNSQVSSATAAHTQARGEKLQDQMQTEGAAAAAQGRAMGAAITTPMILAAQKNRTSELQSWQSENAHYQQTLSALDQAAAGNPTAAIAAVADVVGATVDPNTKRLAKPILQELRNQGGVAEKAATYIEELQSGTPSKESISNMRSLLTNGYAGKVQNHQAQLNIINANDPNYTPNPKNEKIINDLDLRNGGLPSNVASQIPEGHISTLSDGRKFTKLGGFVSEVK